MKQSKELTRTQLIGMCASLKGELAYLLYVLSLYRENGTDNWHEDINGILENAAIVLKSCDFELSEKDMVNKGFDKSWIDS